MRMFLIPIAMLALSACATTAEGEVDGSNVRLGQTATVNGPRVRPVEVLEDSRCPENVQCAWAGRVRLKMIWERQAGNQEFELILGQPKPLADGAIVLTSVRPEKTADTQLKPADYRFSFEFQGGI